MTAAITANGVGVGIWMEGCFKRPKAHEHFRLDEISRVTSAQLDGLGQLVDAVEDSGGRLFILDASKHRILITDRRLHLLGQFGRRGKGAGEFIEPVSIGAFAGGEIAVLDRSLRRVVILAVREDGRSIAQLSSVELTIPNPESMCALKQRDLLIYGLYNGARLHVFDLKGHLLRSFGSANSDLSPNRAKCLDSG